MVFAVLGAGNGGQAMAAYLALQGYDVNLYNRTRERIKGVIKAGGIELNGVYKGFGKLRKITTKMEEAIAAAEIIMVVTPAVAHQYLAREISPFLKNGQRIVLNPGRTGGALEFYNVLKDNGCKADVIISEAQTFLYASRITGPAQVTVFGVKKRVAIAAFPSSRTRELVDDLFEVFPQFIPVENVLKTSLDNIGAVFHPAPTLLNMAWIETTAGKFTYYQQGITPSLAKILEEIDQERMEVAYALGIEPLSACDWLRMSYDVKGRNLYELIQSNYHYHDIGAPATIKHRYIFEDVPMSLVPISSLGKQFKIQTPTIDMIINLANIVYQTDFWQKGRTVDSLGLKGLSKSEILRLVNVGVLDNVEVLPTNQHSIYQRIDDIIYKKYPENYQKEVE